MRTTIEQPPQGAVETIQEHIGTAAFLTATLVPTTRSTRCGHGRGRKEWRPLAFERLAKQGGLEALAAAVVLPRAPGECPATRAKLAEVRERPPAVPLKVSAGALTMIMEQCRRAGEAGRRR